MSADAIYAVMEAEAAVVGITLTPWSRLFLRVVAKGIEAALAPLWAALP